MGTTPKYLTRQQEILEYIKLFRASRGFGPSFKQIGNYIGIRSMSLVQFYLNNLEKEGEIKREFGTARSITVVE